MVEAARKSTGRVGRREIAFEARAAALATMRRRLKRVLHTTHCAEQEIDSIVIAVNEACMNIIQHAYRGDCAQPIRIGIECDGDSVRFEVLDRAPPIDLHSVQGRSDFSLRPGGLGVHFIRELMDEVHYTHLDDAPGNRLRMTWRRPATRRDDPA